jgi:hypothetical protein
MPFAGHGGRAFWGMNCFLPLEHRHRGFESHSKRGCLCVFILDVGTGWSPVQGVIPTA